MPPNRPRLDALHPSMVIASLQHHAATRPDAASIVELHDGGQICSWAELMALVACRAASLRRTMRVGETLVTALPAGIESISWFLGAISAGMRVLPMHTQIAGPEAQSVMKRVNATLAVTATEIRAADVFDQLTTLAPEYADQGTPIPAIPTDSAGSVILESSGTCGLPKLVLRESAALDAVASNVIAGITLRENDRIIFPTPLSHSYGVDTLVAAISAGATLCVMNQYDPDRVAYEIVSGATVLLGTPFVYESLARRSQPSASTVRVALSAGSPLLDSIGIRFHEKWRVEIGQLYGATELGTVTMSVPGSNTHMPGSIGLPLPQVSMSVMDINNLNQAAPTGTEGHLVVNAPSMLTCYLGDSTETINGALQTGDLARQDAAGRFWITGRLKLMVDVGGYKVNPLEIEDVLLSHPSIAEAVVIPIIQSPTIRRLRALVVLNDTEPPTNSLQLRAFLKDRLSSTKVPRVVNIVPSLPKSPTGKVLRSEVISNWS
jgi:long-chain acyl-CoA synthetase